MFNTANGSGVTVAEKLGIDSEVRELKFGSSFNPGSRGQQGASAFHTIRYDFKPASVDTSKMATMELGASKQVTISMPHYDTNGTTVFKGPIRDYSKECVLIIDKDTGEFVLEKLNHNLSVKKTRQERPEGASRNSSKVAPPPPADLRPSVLSTQSEHKSSPKDEKNKRPSSSNSSSAQQQQSQAHSLNPSSVRRRPISPMPSGPAKHSPLGPPPGHNSPPYGTGAQHASASSAFDSLVHSKQHQQAQSFMPSLTSIEDLLITPPVQNPGGFPQTKAPVPKTGGSGSSNSKHSKEAGKEGTNALSESSSGDSSSSSSSDDDDDDSSSVSDMEEVMPDKIPIPPVIGREKARTPPVPLTMSMPSFMSLGNNPPPSKPAPPPTMSMPSHLLSEDLQLSESGSDSD